MHILLKYAIDKECSDIDGFAKKFDAVKLSELGMIPQKIAGNVKIITCNPANTLTCEDYISEQTGYSGVFTYLLTTESNLKRLINNTFETVTDLASIEVTGSNSFQNGIYNIADDDISGIVTLVNKLFREAADAKSVP